VPPKPQGNTFVQPKPEGNTFVPPKPQSNTRGGDNNARQGQQGVFGQGQQGNTFVPPNPQGNTQNQGQQGTFGQGQQGNTFVPPKPQSNTRGGDNNARQGQQGAFGQGQQGAFGQGRPFIPFNDGRPPMAADRGANDFRPGDRTHEWHLGQGDVPDSRNYDWNRRRDHNGGMTDFEKFGLIALGAVTIGALLSNGNTVMSNSGDRVIYRDTYGNYGVYHDDDVLIRRPGDTITTQSFDDGSVATRIVQQDGSVILTVLDANGRVLRRTVTYPNGREVLLFDDTRVLPPPVVAQLPPESPVDVLYTTQTGPDLLRAAFLTKPFQAADRAFNLSQIRDIPQVRYLAPEVELTTLGFASGSSEVSPDQAQTLAVLGHVMADLIAQNPAEVFLIEGHSDAVGDPAMNLALSDARAQTTAMALTEYFGVPPQNLITQGYGATDMKSPSQGSNDANRRIVVRRITGLLPAAGQ
jgi:outer membrane protein OmpA-like peptidoglycan-associated protein